MARNLWSVRVYLVFTTLTGNQANGPLTVHAEITGKRTSVAEHNPQVFGMTRFNMEALREPPAQVEPIHISLSQWNDLFDKLQNGDQESLSQILELLGVSQKDWQSVLELKKMNS